MSTVSKIEWTEVTWNPVLGCDRVSPGCDSCYAITGAHIRKSNPNPKIAAAYAGLTTRTKERVDWTGRVNLLEDRLDSPLRWRKPRRVFVNSMSDLFHDKIEARFIAKIFGTMAATPRHTYQVLTKRHARMRSLLNDREFRRLVYEHAWAHDQGVGFDQYRYARDQDIPTEYERVAFPPDDRDWWPLPNVWLGVSAEDQKRADLRIPALLDTPATVRWISAEPLLGPIDLRWCAGVDAIEPDWTGGPGGGTGAPHPLLDWVIVGGESGRGDGIRPMHPDWARSLRDQCVAAGVPFFFKQWGEWGPAPWSVRIPEPVGGWDTADPGWLAGEKVKAEQHGATHCVCPDGSLYEPDHKTWSLERDPDGHYPGAIRRWGKKAAGRDLDGREWNEFPTAQASAA